VIVDVVVVVVGDGDGENLKQFEVLSIELRARDQWWFGRLTATLT
jgi:hypothetical protein